MRTEKEDLLLTSARYNSLGLVKQCVTGGFLGWRGKVSIETRNDEGLTALHIAALRCNREIAFWLIKHGANVNALADESFTPLMAAAKGGDAEIVRQLLDNGADIHAAKTGEDEGETALIFALASGNKEAATLLLDEGASWDIAGPSQFTPLMGAARHGFTSIVQRLLESGAEVNVEKTGNDLHWTALTFAAWQGQADACRILLEHGASVDTATEAGWTPLHWAVRDGFTDTVKILLAGGADPDKPKCDGWTPLFLAAFNGHNDIITLLLEKGVDVNHRDENGETAIFKAVEKDLTDTLRLLERSGASTDMTNHKGDTLLHHGVIHESLETLRHMLHTKMLDSNAKDSDGWTPLLRAAEKNLSKFVQAFLDHDVDVTCTTSEGLNAHDLAHRFGHKTVEKILAGHGIERTEGTGGLVQEISGAREPITGPAGYPEISAEHIELELVDSAYLTPGGSGGPDFQEAITFMNQQDDGSAEKRLRSALEKGLDPMRDGYAKANLGTICIRNGKLDEGVDLLVSVLTSGKALHESAHDAANYLAVVYAELGRNMEAASLRQLVSRTSTKLGYTLSPDTASAIRSAVRRRRKELDS